MNRRGQKTARSRSGFAIIEPFLVTPVFLLVGFGTSMVIRTWFESTHWLTWIPTIVLGLPFAMFYGLVPIMALASSLRDWRNKKS
jgi:hypothetical protein